VRRENKAWRAISSLLAFYTTIPANGELDEAARWSFLAPAIIGGLEGLLLYGVLLAGWWIVGPLAGLFVIAGAELIRGFHHLDGLLDVGDAIMVRDRERRRKALKDVQIGAGAIGFLLIYLSIALPSVLVLRPSIYFLAVLVAASICSRSLGLLLLALVKPMEGSVLGARFSLELSGKKFVLLGQSIPLLTSPAAAGVFAATLLLWVVVSKRSLGGSSGDVVGAAITISFPLLILAEVKWPWFWYLR
jgi:cobalamin 5''-phosphate synthase/cobalamin synthase